MDEALDAIMALLAGETVTTATDWFTLQDARLQLRPFSTPSLEVAVAASISPAGARAAGRHGLGLLSVAATTKQGFDAIGTHWKTWSETCAAHGHVADRDKWRLVVPMHIAETKEQARRDVEYGIVQFTRYFTHVLPAGPVRGETAQEIIENTDADGFAVIGTPDDAIEKIRELEEVSGGYGVTLLWGHDWATPEATRRSYELIAQYVMPHFDGQAEWPERSCEWVTGSGGEFVNRAANAIMKAIQENAGN
jgi:limonene 1,2-monooxygenase